MVVTVPEECNPAEFEERRDFPVAEVIDGLGPLAQPELLQTAERAADLVSRRRSNPDVETGAIVALMPAQPAAPRQG